VDSGKPASGRVFILEDDLDAREILSLVLREAFSIDSIEAASFDEMIKGNDVLSCSLAILDVNLGPGQRSGLDAYHWLREQHFPGNVVFLTGHAADHPLVRKARLLGEASVLSKPISLERLGLLVHEVGVHRG
jgi:DNA-binding response OmpR family regulator